MKHWRKDWKSSNKKSGNPKTSLTLRQKQLLASNNKDDFFTVFNEVHNSHLITTSVGEVIVRTGHGQKKTHKLKSQKRN